LIDNLPFLVFTNVILAVLDPSLFPRSAPSNAAGVFVPGNT
jgi:hypothetical protein